MTTLSDTKDGFNLDPAEDPGPGDDKDRRMNRVRLLENVRLPKVVKLPDKYGTVAEGTMLACLRVLDGFARDKAICWPKLATIAARMGKSRSSAKRAIRALQCLDLLSVEKVIVDNEYRSSRYQVIWANVIEYDQRPSEHPETLEHPESPHRPCEVDRPPAHKEPGVGPA